MRGVAVEVIVGLEWRGAGLGSHAPRMVAPRQRAAGEIGRPVRASACWRALPTSTRRAARTAHREPQFWRLCVHWPDRAASTAVHSAPTSTASRAAARVGTVVGKPVRHVVR